MKNEPDNRSENSTENAALTHREKLALLRKRLEEKAGGQRQYPLSYNQQAIWAFYQAHPDSPSYNLKFSARILGPLHVPALKTACRQIPDRHALLRTTYAASENGPVQQVQEQQELSFTEIQDPGWSPEERKKQVQFYYRLPFTLENGPVFRVHLFTRSATDHVLLLTIHHIACDGWSLLVLLDELKACYEAALRQTSVPLPVPLRSYHDFINDQLRFINSEKGNKALHYWKQQLGEDLPLLDLPAASPREERQRHRGATFLFSLSKPSLEQYKRLAQKEDVTLHTFFLAAFNVLLHRYTGQEDLVVGIPVSEREHLQLDSTVGHFINPVAIRSNFAADPGFGSLLQQVRNTLLNGLTYKEYPFPLLVRQLHLQREPGYAPVFQALMVMQKLPPALSIGKLFLFDRKERIEWTEGLQMESFDFPEQEGQFDLVLELREGQDGIACAFKYNSDLFDEPAIERMSHHFKCLLRSIVLAPEERVSRLPMTTPDEQAGLLLSHNRAYRAFGSDKCMHQLFEEQVLKSPEAIALTREGEHLSYRELNHRANRLAHQLHKKGVVANQLVGLLSDRSFEMIVGILGILKAGGAYLPLDPDYPPERLAFMLRDADIKLLLLKKETAPPPGLDLAAIEPIFLDQDSAGATAAEGENLNLELSSDNLAYVIYTSGSTGLPKGVLIPHSNIHRLFLAAGEWFHFNENDVWTLFHSFAFDFSVWEIWGALIYGGRLLIVPFFISRSPEVFYRLLLSENVTVLNQTPSAFRQLIAVDREIPAQPMALRYVIFGGEPLEQQCLRPWFEKHGDTHPRLINMYGITETTVHVTYKLLKKGDAYAPDKSIGVPLPDLLLFILDKGGEPVPPGVRGELYVGGAGLAKGYLNRPELTSERFGYPLKQRPDLLLYKTGDLACGLANGEVAYLGRNDAQVKIRGFRIEPGEIEFLLNRHPTVSDSAVQVLPAPGGPQLVAYVIPGKAAPVSLPGLREYLQKHLPAHMVPAHFIEIAAIPLTANGKINRKALPLPDNERAGADITEATTETEKTLAGIWRQVLSLPQIDVHENFFALGGDSINALQIISKAKEQGLHLSVKELFQYQTIHKLAALTKEGERKGPDVNPGSFSLLKGGQKAALPDGAEDAFPLSSLQLGMVYHYLTPEKSGFIYHNINSFRFEAPFVEEKLKEAIAFLMSRHPVLRTCILLQEYDEPVQLIYEGVEPPLSVEDLSPYSEDVQKARFESWFEQEKRSGFDLKQPPLFRFHVFVYSSADFELTLTEHHAILDGWSMATLMTELLQTYHLLIKKEKPASEPPLLSSFRDYVLAERGLRHSEEALTFWKAEVNGLGRCFLPRWPDHYLENRGSGEATKLPVPLPEAVSAQLVALSVRLHLPVKSILLAAHCYVLSLLHNGPQVVTGLVANGRFEEKDGDRVLGLFLHALPFALQLHGGPWTALIKKVFEKENSLQTYRRFPLQELQHLKHGKPLFETLFNFTHFHIYELAANLEGIKFQGARFFERTNYALTVHFNKHPLTSQLQLHISFDPGKIAPEQVTLIGNMFQTVLASIAADPESLSEQHRLSGTDLPYKIPHPTPDTKVYFGGEAGRYLLLGNYVHQQSAHRFEDLTLLGYSGYPCTVGIPGTLHFGQQPFGKELIRLPKGDMCFYKPGDVFVEQRNYWLSELNNLPVSPFSDRGSSQPFPGPLKSLQQTLAPDVMEKTKSIADNAQYNLPSFLLAGLFLSLYLQWGQSDIIVGLPLAGETDEKNPWQAVHILPIRIQINEAKQIDALAAEIQQKTVEALKHRYPFDQLLEDIKKRLNPAQNPVRVMALFQDMPLCPDRYNPATLINGTETMPTGTAPDLLFVAKKQQREFCIQLLYNGRLLDDSAVGKFLESYFRILEQMAAAPLSPIASFALALTDEELKEQEQFLKAMDQL